MKKFLRKILIKQLKKRGLQIITDPDINLARKLKLMEYHQIDTLFDVGANTGQFVKKIRNIGYKNRIISFEPVKGTFVDLELNCKDEPNWIGVNAALGEQDMKSEINIAGNTESSSLLNMLPLHVKSAPTSEYIGKEEIQIHKFDSIYNRFCNNKNSVMLKIDTQGYEKNVLDGAVEFLDNIKIIQLEMSIAPLYENEMLFTEMVKYLEKKGFQLFSLENGHADPATGRLLQVDGVFENIKFSR